MFRDKQQQEDQPSLKNIPTQSWYPPSVLSRNSTLSRALSQSAGRVSSPSISISSPLSNSEKLKFESGLLPQSSTTRVLPINSLTASSSSLNGKSFEELKKLLTDKAAYEEFLHSLDHVKSLDILQEDLWRSSIDLAKQNLNGEFKVAELRNQCAILRTTELAAAEENLDKAQEQMTSLMEQYSVTALADKLREAAEQADEESEQLQQQLLAGELDLTEFLPKYRKLRVLYHKRVLTGLAAGGTIATPG